MRQAIVPAILPASQEEFEREIALLTHLSLVRRIQIDVVDGHFATPASWPATAPHELASRVAKGDRLPALDRIAYEIDLMCLNPERAAEAWVALGASRLTFHIESVTDPVRLLTNVHAHFGSAGITSDLITIGLALNIETDTAFLESVVNNIAYLQLMGIARIGRQGQPFDRRVVNKVVACRAKYPDLPIQIDGGVSVETAQELLSAGVTDLVVGSRITGAANPDSEFRKFADMLDRSQGVTSNQVY